MNNLRHYREKSDLTLAELANATGIEVTKLSRVEAGGRDLKGQEWKLVAEKLDCSIDELLNYNNNPSVSLTADSSLYTKEPLVEEKIMKSIVQSEKVCYITGDEYNLHKHHVYNGANRKTSEKYGLVIYLRADWHNMEKYSIHMDAELDRRIKAEVQKIAMEHYGWTVEDFIRLIGKSYI